MAIYDLEERTFQFAKSIRGLSMKLPKTPSNVEDMKQLIRSSASVGANYIEANEALSKERFPDASENFKKRSERKCIFPFDFY